jgi:hypothetical protein
MNIEDMVVKLEKTDFHTWMVVRNRATNSIWLSEEEDGLKINLRKTGDTWIVRLYEFDRIGTTFSNSQRILITKNQINHYELIQSLDNTELHENVKFTLHELDDLYREDSFFQRSLVENVGDLTHDLFIRLMALYDEAAYVGEVELNAG